MEVDFVKIIGDGGWWMALAMDWRTSLRM